MYLHVSKLIHNADVLNAFGANETEATIVKLLEIPSPTYEVLTKDTNITVRVLDVLTDTSCARTSVLNNLPVDLDRIFVRRDHLEASIVTVHLLCSEFERKLCIGARPSTYKTSLLCGIVSREIHIISFVRLVHHRARGETNSCNSNDKKIYEKLFHNYYFLWRSKDLPDYYLTTFCELNSRTEGY